jgi:hypothetical protein
MAGKASLTLGTGQMAPSIAAPRRDRSGGGRHSYAARLTAAANPISAVPTRTIAASSRSPAAGMLTCWTATDGAVSGSAAFAGRPVAMSDDAHSPITPTNIKQKNVLRMTRILNLSITVWRPFVLAPFLRNSRARGVAAM